MFIEIHFMVKILLEITIKRVHNTWATHYFYNSEELDSAVLHNITI